MFKVLAIVVVSLTMLAIVACGESEEEAARKVLREIYADNVAMRVGDEMANQGKSAPTVEEYRVVCGEWKDFDYIAVTSADEDTVSEMVKSVYDWQEDNDATVAKREKIEATWIVLSSVTKVLQRELDTIFDAKDFCEHHTN